MKPTSVCVLLGGPSAEHDVSIVSGRAIANALAARGQHVEGWLIGLDGQWWQLPTAALAEELPQRAYDDPAALDALGPHSAAAALDALAGRDPAPVVFVALHGPFGEDGTVQALCEAVGLIYTGAGVAASAIGMDKLLFRRLAAALGMPVLPSTAVSAADWAAGPALARAQLADFVAALPDPRLIVKPSQQGSSIGITIVHRPDDADELGGALDDALRYGDTAMVEAYLAHARELEMSVVGNSARDLEVFGPGEIFPGREFYDYVAKYQQGISRTTDQPDVEPRMREQLRDLAGRAFLAIGGTGFARVDFLASAGQVYLNEINTIPGFTPISLFPVLCRAGGYDFGAIAERIVDLAIDRARYRPRGVLTRADLP